MPIVRVHRNNTPENVGGTILVTNSPLDISSGVTVELRPSVFNRKGIWTLFSFPSIIPNQSGSYASYITLDTSGLSGLSAGIPYRDGNKIKVVLS
jgi:hypothetical protein